MTRPITDLPPCFMLEFDDYLRPAIADIVWFEDFQCFVLTRINVPIKKRGEGHGTKLLLQVLEAFDREGLELMLAPESSAGGTIPGLDQNELIAWYYRHGFSFTRSLAMMSRSPAPSQE